MKRLIMATALAVAALTAPASAQAPAEHDSHHPSGSAQSPPIPESPIPPANQPGMGSMQGGATMPMMSMMDSMKTMMSGMSMMNTMGMMQSMGMTGPGMGGMATMDHVEGRIAFLRTELKITEAQASAWNAFADSLRANANKLGEIRASMMGATGDAQLQTSTIADRLDLQEKWLLARLEGTRMMKSALAKLNEVLSENQKGTANELLAPHMGMGMMAMMAASMQPSKKGQGTMQPDQMRPGRMQSPRN
jgi:hypothetical protein